MNARTRRIRLRSIVLVVAIFFGSALFPFGAAAGPIWSKKGVEPYRLPVSRVVLTKKKILRPHHDYPAWDFNTPVGTKTFSVQAGRVIAVLHSGACGLGIVIDGFDGFRYTYCHGSRALVGGGRRVHAGDPIMRTGSSGNATNAHLHFEIEKLPRLRLKCPQPLLLAWWRGRQMTPRQAPSRGCIS
jgi:murein DD-endopeptidase MepM/ murein hydrolase activator NlpD